MDKLFQFSTKNNQHEKIKFHQGYCYDCRADDKRTVICHERKIKKCSAYGKIDALSNIILLRGHTHAKNNNLKLIFDCKLELFKTVISSSDSLKHIYDKISVKHQHAATLMPFCRMQKTMQQWRKKIHPPIPGSLGEYVLRLKINRWQHLYRSNGSNFTVTNVYGEDGSIATFFIDPDLLKNISETSIYTDATYKVCPKKPGNIYQILTIMISVNGAVLPIAWSLMSRKSSQCYAAIFNHLKQFTVHMRILSYMTDFELGLRNALRDCYPDAIGYGCYFHFVQALRKKAKSLKLIQKLRNWEDGKTFLRKIIALAFLPYQDIENTFHWLLQIYLPFLPIFNEFLQYFQNFWLNIITPQNFSIYKLKNRTNNYAESYHRQLNSKFGLHPSIWKFTECLRNLHGVTKIELNSLLASQIIRRETRANQLLRSDIIEKAWEYYETDIYDIAHFLECFNHIIPVLDNDLLITNINDLNQFINIPIYKYIAISESKYLKMEINETNNFKYILIFEEK